MSERPLIDSYVRKGGQNKWPSQVIERPPAPPPSRPRDTLTTADAQDKAGGGIA